MIDGPVDYLIVQFPANRLPPQLVSALVDLVELETIRLLDLVVVVKDTDGSVRAVEIDDLDPDTRDLFVDLEGEYDGLVSEADLAEVGEALPVGTTAALLVWENRWAARFAMALRDAGGEVLVNDRIPRLVVENALAALV